MYKCLHELYIKTVPDTSLHETSGFTYANEVLIVGASLMLKAVKNKQSYTLRIGSTLGYERPLH
jgi:uncharacterized protein (UPF0254 family)